jgi:hypothetical protein
MLLVDKQSDYIYPNHQVHPLDQDDHQFGLYQLVANYFREKLPVVVDHDIQV